MKQVEKQIERRADELFTQDYEALHRRTDRIFAILMVFQWAGAILMALLVSPKTWNQGESSVHIHLWTAIILGGLLTSFPVFLVVTQPGRASTRQVIGISQTLFSAMLIHLSGGRIETHFHIFGSLAFLAFYRDWKVLLTSTIIVAVDHLLRGIYWPQSVFGVLAPSNWRWLEHAAWVVFEDIVLIAYCNQGIREMRDVSTRHAELEATNEIIDTQVRDRTAELAEARENLEQQVEERTSELAEALACVQRTNLSLQEANRHKSRFLSTMSHELRTPLNAITGFADLLAGEGFGPLNSKQKKYVARIDDSGAHLLSLINDVLDLTKIEMGAMELSPESVGIQELLQGAASMVSSQFEEKGIALNVNPEAVSLNVLADRRRTRQILLNLLSNALKYAPSGTEVSLNANRPDGNRLRISVSDQGVGVEAAKQQRIFDEFQQADRERDEALGGIGLGLSLTRRLVELHQGEIGVESTVGEGSTFWFTLPIATHAAESTPTVSRETLSNPVGDGRLILVAEDSEVNLAVLTDNLEIRGYEVVAARNGKECIELARKHLPQMIITDIRMPVMDGLEAVQLLREEPTFAHLPIIALTADASHVSRDECLGAGCTAHFTKPIDAKKLYPAIQQLLEASEGAKA